MEIRKATVDDAEAACIVLRRSIAELCHADHLGDPDALAEWLANKTPENMRLWIAAPGNCVLVATIDGQIASVSAITSRGHVTLNYVAPEFRFLGVSKALLLALELRAKEAGLTTCTLKSTKTALEFYRSAGYGTSSDDTESASIYNMAKSLRP
jgi:GNAT superfamily N-acetyltransferase